MRALLFFFVSLSAFGQTVAVYNTISQMDTNAPSNRETHAQVSGFYTPGDWGSNLKYFRYDKTNSLATNAVRRAVPSGVGRRVLDGWDGDPRVFGAKFSGSTTNDAALNQAALQAALDHAELVGTKFQMPPGTIHILGNLDAANVSEIAGTSSGPSAIETDIILCQKGASFLTNVTSGAVIHSFKVRPLHRSWFRDDTTSSILTTANGQYAIKIRNIEGYSYLGLQLSGWDFSVKDCDIWGAQGLNFPYGGTQSDVSRVAIRSAINACSTNSSTSITIASYTAGQTNFTVSDGQPLRVGDMIMTAGWTAPGYSNPLQGKTWGRKITAVSGNNVTINYPWPTSFSNGIVYYLLGQGLSAVYTVSENQFQNLNVEYGSWNSVIACVSAGVNVDSLHVEGWMCDLPGVNATMFAGNQGVVSVGKLDIVNCVTTDATTVSIFDTFNGYDVGTIYLRDWDLFHSQQKVYVAAARSLTRPNRVRVGPVLNFGVPLVEPDPGFWQLQGSSFMAGDQYAMQQRVGKNNMHFYGFTNSPTFGSFVAGDKIYLPDKTLNVTSSGNLGTPSGNFKIRTNSSVLVTDSTGRGYVGDRTVVSIGGSPYIADRPALGGAVSMTIASNAVAGDRDVWVTTASGQIGDWGIINFSGSTYEDVRFQRIVTTTTPNRMHLALPLVNSYSAGTTLESGVHLTTPSQTDVTNLTAIAYATPAFATDVKYVAGSFGITDPVVFNTLTATGAVSLGQTSSGNTLRVIGGLSGQRHILLDRPGVSTNGIGSGSGGFTFYRDDTHANVLGVMSMTADSTTISLVGGATSFNTTNGRTFNISSVASGSGSNVLGGNINVLAGEGTGGGTPSRFSVSVPITTNNPTAVQSRLSLFAVQAPQAPNVLSSNTGVRIRWLDATTNWVEWRMVVTNEGGIYRPIFIP